MPAATIKQEGDIWKAGQLHSGSKTGPIVPHTPAGQKQMLAIYFSEHGERKKGGKLKTSKKKARKRLNHGPMAGMLRNAFRR